MFFKKVFFFSPSFFSLFDCDLKHFFPPFRPLLRLRSGDRDFTEFTKCKSDTKAKY